MSDRPPRSVEKLGISYAGGDAGFSGTSPICVYTTPSCRPCKRVIALLEKSGLDFEVVDLSDPAYADAWSYVTNVLGAKSTPVIVSDTHDPILGYQPEKIKALINALTLTLNGENV